MAGPAPTRIINAGTRRRQAPLVPLRKRLAILVLNSTPFWQVLVFFFFFLLLLPPAPWWRRPLYAAGFHYLSPPLLVSLVCLLSGVREGVLARSKNGRRVKAPPPETDRRADRPDATVKNGQLMPVCISDRVRC